MPWQSVIVSSLHAAVVSGLPKEVCEWRRKIGEPQKAEGFLLDAVKMYRREGWHRLAHATMRELAACQAKMGHTKRLEPFFILGWCSERRGPRQGHVIRTGVRYAFVGPFEAAHLNADGMDSYLERYADMIYNIQKLQGEPEKMIAGPTLDAIKKDMESVAGPLSDLQKRRQWRDRRLAALAKLKVNMAATDNTQ